MSQIVESLAAVSTICNISCRSVGVGEALVDAAITVGLHGLQRGQRVRMRVDLVAGDEDAHVAVPEGRPHSDMATQGAPDLPFCALRVFWAQDEKEPAALPLTGSVRKQVEAVNILPSQASANADGEALDANCSDESR